MALTPASDNPERAKLLEDRRANPLDWGVGRNLEQQKEAEMLHQNQSTKKGK